MFAFVALLFGRPRFRVAPLSDGAALFFRDEAVEAVAPEDAEASDPFEALLEHLRYRRSHVFCRRCRLVVVVVTAVAVAAAIVTITATTATVTATVTSTALIILLCVILVTTIAAVAARVFFHLLWTFRRVLLRIFFSCRRRCRHCSSGGWDGRC